MKDRGAGIDEKHFPSRISLQLTPTIQTNILSVSVSRSSENPTLEIGVERSIEGSFEPPNQGRPNGHKTLGTSLGPPRLKGHQIFVILGPFKLYSQNILGPVVHIHQSYP
ncbi:hypothetical protein Hanom_Chr14g01326851 [Helianthus anomalus]